ncbi:hypothetical protein O181_070124 [Austropuccinia psidii MF-1]|uniref:DUF4939 domain-containing protein n=1 Tax=Austropuccinia psidii MF-1 TaxID=1389203 RepID=A0A9Q3I966_9BASI|nr:hypothetical protein [Austropuccinia psidii MF-1]
MPVQHSPPAKNTRSQRNPDVLTPTARVPLDCTASVHQLSANWDRDPPMEGAALSRRGGMKSRRSRSFSSLLGGYPGMSEGARARLGEAEDEEGEEFLEEEDSEEIQVETALAGVFEASEAANLAHSNQPLASQAEQKFLKMMEQMTHFMGQLSQAVAHRDNSKAPALKTLSMKAPDSFDGTQAHKLRGFIQSCQLIFHSYPANFFSDRVKVLYSTSFLTGRAGKWIEPYLSNISNEDPSYLLNNWKLFETQLFTLFGDPNEVRKAEQELDNLRMKESSHVSLTHGHYHERQKEKGSHQEKKPLVTGSNSSRPPQDPSSKRTHHKKNRKGKQFQASKDNPHADLLNKDNKLIGSKKERKIKEGLCTYFCGKHPIEKCFKRSQNKPGSSRAFPGKEGKA